MSEDWLGTLNLSRSFLEGGLILQKAQSNPAAPNEPIYFLFHHAIELLLKAFLEAKNVDRTVVRKFSHDLGEALRKATEAGLVLSADSKKFIEEIPMKGGQVEIRYFERELVLRHSLQYSRSKAVQTFIEVAPQAFRGQSVKMPVWYLSFEDT